MSALDVAVARIHAEVPQAIERHVQRLAEDMLEHPCNIVKAVLPLSPPSTWTWPPSRPLPDLYRAAVYQLQAGDADWVGAFDLLAAKRALGWMIAAEGNALQAVARAVA
jgi:hypothetical protein